MAFCNSCGATLEPGAKFCNKCGSTSPMTGSHPVASSPASSTPAAQPQSSNALKIILIVVAVIVGLGILGFGTMAFLVHKAIKGTHIEERNGNVKVETPFGTVESSDNAKEAANNLGVAVYPGATALKGSASVATFGGMHTAAAEFETSDSADKVAEFYKSELPNANIVSSEGDHYAIISSDKKNMITVSIEPQDGKTRIHIANVTGKPPGSNSTN
jgi:flagellar basal body-associated protein FliL